MLKKDRNKLFQMTQQEFEEAMDRYYSSKLKDNMKPKESILPFDTMVEIFDNILYEREVKKYHETIYGS